MEAGGQFLVSTKGRGSSSSAAEDPTGPLMESQVDSATSFFIESQRKEKKRGKAKPNKRGKLILDLRMPILNGAR
jgi:hypothetical protein